VLGIWALASIILALIYPGKQTSDMVWAALPLWLLAALELSRHFDFEGKNLWEFAGGLVVVIALLVFGWLNTASLSNMDITSSLAHTRIWLLVAVLFLIVLTILLVWTGWSAAVARLSGVWAQIEWCLGGSDLPGPVYGCHEHRHVRFAAAFNC